MKSRKPLLTALATGALIFTGALIAQDAPPGTSPAPAMSTPMPPATPTPAAPMPPGQPASPAEPMPPPGSAQPAQPEQSMPSPMPTPTPAPGEPMPSTTPMPAGASTAADMPAATPAAGQNGSQAAQGEVEVRSVPPPAPEVGPAPDFDQLSGGSKSITEDQAVAYPPLANDFINADRNRNGKISKVEYSNWTKQL